MRVSTAPGADRGGYGRQGDREQFGSTRGGDAGRHWRYHSRFADPSSQWRSHGRSHRRTADSAVDGDSQLQSASNGVSGMRAHHEYVFSGDGGADPELPARADAELED